MADKITVALIYDFDGTLAPGNMQEYDFIPAVGKSNMEFWHEANTLAEEQDADQVLTYMARMIQAAQSKGLSLRREAFRESGRNVKFYAGVEEWFKRINEYGEKRGVNILHYVNSSGLKEIIEGTAIAHEFKNIYACSFLYNVESLIFSIIPQSLRGKCHQDTALPLADPRLTHQDPHHHSLGLPHRSVWDQPQSRIFGHCGHRICQILFCQADQFPGDPGSGHQYGFTGQRIPQCVAGIIKGRTA